MVLSIKSQMQEREPALYGLKRKPSKIQWTIQDVFTVTVVWLRSAVQIMRAMQTVGITRNAVAQIQSPYKDLEFLRAG